MKKTILALLAATVVAFTVSCNREKREVERIAQAYLDAETNFRIEEARKYASPEFMPMLNQIENFVLPNMPDEVLKSIIPNKITIKNTEIFGDTAIVSFHASNPTQETDAQIMMVRYDTAWLVVQQGEKVNGKKNLESLDVQPETQQNDTITDALQKK